jgi:hypothetical protein
MASELLVQIAFARPCFDKCLQPSDLKEGICGARNQHYLQALATCRVERFANADQYFGHLRFSS